MKIRIAMLGVEEMTDRKKDPESRLSTGEQAGVFNGIWNGRIALRLRDC